MSDKLRHLKNNMKDQIKHLRAVLIDSKSRTIVGLNKVFGEPDDKELHINVVSMENDLQEEVDLEHGLADLLDYEDIEKYVDKTGNLKFSMSYGGIDMYGFVKSKSRASWTEANKVGFDDLPPSKISLFLSDFNTNEPTKQPNFLAKRYNLEELKSAIEVRKGQRVAKDAFSNDIKELIKVFLMLKKSENFLEYLEHLDG